MPKVYIIILNYNGWRDTIACLESVLKLVYVNYSLVVIDNCSNDGSVERITEWALGSLNGYNNDDDLTHLINPPCKKPIKFYTFLEDQLVKEKFKTSTGELIIIQAGSNRGFSAGNNVGIRYALLQEDAEYVWLLNNDTLVSNDSLKELVTYHSNSKESRKIGIVGGVILYYDNPETIQCLGGATYNKYLGLVKQCGNGKQKSQIDNISNCHLDYISGACMLVPIAFIKDVGLMNEDYFLYYEEIDWCKRGQIKGWEIDYSPLSRIFHKEGATVSKGKSTEKSHLSDYCFLRSKLLYTKHNENFLCNITVNLSLIFSFLIRIYKGQFDRIGVMSKIVINPNSCFFLPKND